MKKETKIFILVIVITVSLVTALDIQTKGKITSLVGSVNPMNLKSSDVPYTNNSQSNVQDAIDQLYTRANSDSFWLKKYKTFADTPTNYINDATNPPTTSSPTTPPSGKNVYLGLYADNQYGVCIKRNGTQHCFRYNNWIAESKHVQEVFSDISCDVRSSNVDCDASDFYCLVYSDGTVNCYDYGTRKYCIVYGGGSVKCN